PRREHGRTVDLRAEVRAEEGDDPVLQLLERKRVEGVVAVLALLANVDQSVIAQHLQVLGHRGLTEAQSLHELSDADLARPGLAGVRLRRGPTLEQHLQEIAPRRIRYHVKNVRHGTKATGPPGWSTMTSCRNDADDAGEQGGAMRARRTARGTTRGTVLSRIRDLIDLFAASSPARFAIVIFTALILLFTALLSLPIASASGTATPLPDALFTAVSSICVTGLNTVNMATHWSAF